MIVIVVIIVTIMIVLGIVTVYDLVIKGFSSPT